MTAAAEQLPPLPQGFEASHLGELDEGELGAVEAVHRDVLRQTEAAMAEYMQQVRELQSRLGEIATERRRRARQVTTSARRQVRDAASSGAAPSLLVALSEGVAAVDDALPLAELRLHLRSGGEVRLGFAGRPGPTSFTNGRATQSATTWGQARQMYAEGWELGSPQIPGVRIHLAGSKVERVVDPDDVVIAP